VSSSGDQVRRAFPIQQVIDRLRESVSMFRQVSAAADLASVMNLQDFPVPCAYALTAGDTFGQVTPGHGQRGEQVAIQQAGVVHFGVVLVVRNYREQRGAQNTDDLEAVLSAARGALLGFIPDVSGARPCQLVRGELKRYDKSTSMWVDVWQTQQMIGGKRP
jgi:hypothetical protein